MTDSFVINQNLEMEDAVADDISIKTSTTEEAFEHSEVPKDIYDFSQSKVQKPDVDPTINVNLTTKGGYKVFVGNVPYHCTQTEFDECFKDVIGFIRAEIITVHKMNTSRGFGFVTVKTQTDAERLKLRDDIVLKGRTLRFTSYQNDAVRPPSDDVTNYVLINGIPDGKTKSWLREKFSPYEPIGKCFVAMNPVTGGMENNGVIEVLDDSKYKNIITKRWHDIDGKMIEATKYKTKTNPQIYGQTYDHTQYSDRRTETNTQTFRKGTSLQVEKSLSGDRQRFNTRRGMTQSHSDDRHRYQVTYKGNPKGAGHKKGLNDKDLYSAFMAGKSVGIMQGMRLLKSN